MHEIVFVSINSNLTKKYVPKSHTETFLKDKYQDLLTI